jgi:hypothetical protein
MICLANSNKLGGRCIAGKWLESGKPGAWVRPVSGRPGGSLYFSDYRLDGAVREPRLLDILDIGFDHPVSEPHQPENFLIAQQPWLKSGTWPVQRLGELGDSVELLWEGGHHGRHGQNDRVPLTSLPATLERSLCLVRPKDLKMYVSEEWGKQKVRARFSTSRGSYILMVTDPVAIYRCKAASGGAIELGSDACLTVSLGEPFQGSRYKLVAAVMMSERTT